MKMINLKFILALVLVAVSSNASMINSGEINMSTLLAFGDSTVDSGNNNRLITSSKANFSPYGQNFFGHHPTGRFCNGRLATDFIVEALGISNSVPAFLDPSLMPEQLRHGVSFASASSGYDEMTATFSNVLPLSKQIEHLMHYKIHLGNLIGKKKAEETVRNAIFVVSAGTNDFIANYYLEPNRSTQFTLPQYENYLIKSMSNYIKTMRRLGGRRFAVVGIPPMGCLPVVRALISPDGQCVDEYNDVAKSFNSKIVAQVSTLKKLLHVRMVYLDVYQPLIEAVNNPIKFGFKETSKGCVGSGTIEIGEGSKGMKTCKDPARYVFWDAVHLTERMYKIIADEAMGNIAKKL